MSVENKENDIKCNDGNEWIGSCSFVMNSMTYCDGYNDDIYTELKEDKMRTKWYQKYINKYVKNKRIIDIGCGSLALLSVLSAKGGGNKIYGIEINKEAYKSALNVIKQNKMLNQIKLINKHSNTIMLNDMDNKKCDIIVHEIIGEIGSCEGVVSSFKYIKKHLITNNDNNGIISIPGFVKTYIACVEFPDYNYWNNLKQKMILPKDTKHINLWNFPERHILTQWELWENIQFNDNSIDKLNKITKEITFKVNKNKGTLSGLLTYIEIGMNNNDPCLSSYPNLNTCHWPNKFIILDNNLDVNEGDIIQLNVSSDFSNDTEITYAFDASKS